MLLLSLPGQDRRPQSDAGQTILPLVPPDGACALLPWRAEVWRAQWKQQQHREQKKWKTLLVASFNRWEKKKEKEKEKAA